MKFNFSFLFVLILSFQLSGQKSILDENNITRCGTDEFHAQQMQDASFAKQYKRMKEEIAKKVDFQRVVVCSSPIIIPVAVHFNGTITAANPTCLIDKCEEQIEVLNQDFGGYNLDITNYCDISDACPADYPPDAVTQGTCIQFCLGGSGHPSCEPAGNLIGGKAITVGQHSWPNTGGCWSGYMNIFVENDTGFLGLAPLNGGANPNGNGVLIDVGAFGGAGGPCTSGTAIDNFGSYNLGRTGTHEVGHYFGLEHTFAGCNDGDDIPDTPDQNSENFGCPSVDLGNCTSTSTNSCGEPDFWFNYMDYVNDACMWMFTEDQSEVMYNTVGNFETGKCTPDQVYNPTYPSGCAANVDPLELFLINSEDLLCFEDFSGTIEVEAIGGVQPYTFYINGINNGDDPYFTNVEAGTHFIEVFDGQGNSQGIFVDILQPDLLVVVPIIQTDESCGGAMDGSFQLEIIGGIPFGQGYNVIVNSIDYNFQTLFTDLSADNYNVEVYDFNDCLAEIDIQIASPPPLEIELDSFISNLCFGDSLALMDFTATGGEPGYNFAIIGDTIANDTGLFVNLGGDSLFVLLTDASDCTLIDTFLIPGPDSLVLSESNVVDNTCFGEATGSTTLLAVGGNGDFTYEVQTLGTTQTGLYDNLASGIYYASVIDSNNCMALDTFEITSPPEIELEIIALTAVTCGGQNDGAIEVLGTGGNGALEYSIDGTNFQASGLFSNLPGGNYTIIVKDNNDCEYSEEIDLPEDSPLEIMIDGLQDALCLGDLSGSISVSSQGGAGTITYELNGAENTTGIFDNLTTGSYTVRAEDDNGCTDNLDFEIGGSSDISFTVIEIQENQCFGVSDGIINVSGSGGMGNILYSINGSAFTANGNFTGLSNGNFDVVVQDNAGCQYTESFTINPATEIEIQNIEVIDLSCFESNDGTVTIDAIGGTGALRYEFYELFLNSSNGVFTNLPAGDWDLLIMDENDCSISQMVTITQGAEITFSVSNQMDSNCDGDPIGGFTITANGGAGNFTYTSGANSNATGIFNNLIADNYEVIITDGDNCSITAFIDVSSGSDILPTLEDFTNPLCNGDSNGDVLISALGGTGNITYNLNGEINSTGFFQNLASGNYVVSITDDADCLVTQNFTLDDVDELILSTSNNQPATCEGGNNGSILLNAIGGNSAYVYEIGSQSNMTGEFNNLPSGSYNATVTDILGCMANVDFTIDGPDPINGFIQNQTDVTCFGDTDGSVTFGSDLTVEIFLNGQLMTNNDLANLPAGVYDFELRTIDDCFELIEVTIGGPADLAISTNDIIDNSCEGQSNGSANFSATGGTGILTYEVNGVENTNGSFSNLGNGNYVLNVTDENVCQASLNFTIEATAQLTGQITNNMPDTGTANGSVNITALGGNGPFVFTLNTGNSNETGIFENLSGGTYTVTIVDSQDCETTLTFEIENKERPEDKNILNVISSPNPTTDFFKLVYESNGAQQIEFRIFDARGRFIINFEQEALSGVNERIFDFSQYAQGVYILEIYGEKITVIQRIIKAP